jgi:S1-C subfamily serine protease
MKPTPALLARPTSFQAMALALVLILPGLAFPCQSSDLATRGRAVFEKHQKSVVTVQIVLRSKFSMPGMPGEAQESNEEATGTVIDPSGLTVLALSSTDPAGLFQSMMAGMGGGDEMEFQMETEVGEVKLLGHDGTEIAAEVILRDRDLDLVFVRPQVKPDQPLSAVDLKDSASAEILEEVVTINRLGPVAGRAYAASIERIQAVVTRPRRFYVPGGDMTTTSLGSPAFTADGKLVGIFVMRALRTSSASSSMFGFQPGNITPIIIPAAEISKIAEQVPPLKP